MIEGAKVAGTEFGSMIFLIRHGGFVYTDTVDMQTLVNQRVREIEQAGILDFYVCDPKDQRFAGNYRFSLNGVEYHHLRGTAHPHGDRLLIDVEAEPVVIKREYTAHLSNSARTKIIRKIQPMVNIMYQHMPDMKQKLIRTIYSKAEEEIQSNVTKLQTQLHSIRKANNYARDPDERNSQIAGGY